MVFPGGFGTLDELFELLTLMQTSKMHRMPVVLVDQDYWSAVINFDRLLQADVISPEDLQLFSFAANAEDAWRKLLQLGLNIGPRPPGLPSL